MYRGSSKFRRRSKALRRLESTVEQLESRVLLSASVFSISDTQVIEGNSDTEMVFVVTRYNPEEDYSQEESVAYFTDPVPNSPFAATTGRFDGTDDYYSQSYVATFAPDEKTTEIRVSIVGDTRNEHDEAIRVTLSPRTVFSSREDLALSNTPRNVYQVIVVDANGVGSHPLLLVAANDPTPQIYVYENLASPGETPQLHLMATLPSLTPATSVVKLAAADFDNDGLQDIVIGDAGGIMIYRQTVDSFSGLTSFSSVYSFATTDLSDFIIGNATDEGFPDLIVADRATSQVTFLVSETTVSGGAIAFAAPQSLTVADHPGLSRIGLSIVGKYAPTLVTLVTPDHSESSLGFNNFASSPGSSALVFNFGNQEPLPVLFDGIEYPGNAVPLNESAADLELGNFGADGRLDLAVSVQGADGRILKVFEDHTEDGSLRLKFDSIPSPFIVGHNPNLPLQSGANLELADFNRDGRSDGGITATLNSFFLFQSTPDVTQSLVPGVGVFEGFTFGDLDSDGSDDVIVFPSGFNEIAWQRNVSQGSGAMAVGTIVNDDPPHVRVSLSRDTLVAGDPLQGNGSIHAELVSGTPLDYDLYVNFEIDVASTATFFNGSNAASADLIVAYIIVRIPAGEISGDQIISSFADAPGQVEPDETAIFQFYGSGDYVLENVGPQTVTIVSAPVIRLVIASNSVTEGQAGQIQLIAFTNKPALVDTDITVNLVTGVSTALTADLFPDGWSSIHIAAGQTYGSLSLAIVDDSIYEGTEYATFELGEIIQGIGRFDPDSQVTATLFDNEPPPDNEDTPQVRLTLSQSTVIAGGNANQSTAKIRAELAGGQPLANDLTVTLIVDVASTASGAGAANPDYSLTSLNVVIPAGSTFGEIALSALPDGAGPLEPDETVVLRATASAAYVLESTAPLTVTIASVPEIRLGLMRSVVTEGDGNQITLVAYSNRSMVVDTDVAVGMILNESTTAVSDFVASTSGVIHIAAGQTSGTFSLAVANDSIFELTEFVTFGLVSIVQGLGRLANSNQITATILDDDALPVVNLRRVLSDGSLTTSFATISETNGSSDLVAVLDSPLSYSISVTLTATGSLSRAEYSTTYDSQSSTSQLPTLVIPAGATRSTVLRVQSLDDSVLESDESLELSVAPASSTYNIGVRGPISLIVVDDDAPPSPLPVVDLRRIVGGGGFLSSTASIAEAAGGTQIVAVIDTPLTRDLTVVVTASGTLNRAEFVSAYNGTSSTTQLQTLTIPAGATRSLAMQISSIDDSVAESDETLTLTAVALPGIYTVGTRGPINLTILDDDTRSPQVTIQASTPSFSENGGVAGFLVTLDRPVSEAVTVHLALSGSASASDYEALSSVVIPAGATVALAWIKGIDDVLKELDETVIATIESITGPVMGLGNRATISIIDDDAPTVVRLIYSANSLDDAGGLRERGGAGTVFAFLSDQTAFDVVVRFVFSGTATKDKDYIASVSEVSIPAGQVAGSIDLRAIADQFVEGSESIVVSIESIVPGPLGRIVAVPAPLQQSVTAVIRDDLRPLLVPRLNTVLFVDEDQTSSPRTFRVYEQSQVLVGPTEFEVVSSNPNLISAADVQITNRIPIPRNSNQDNRHFTVKPKPNQSGTVTLTIRAINEAGTDVMTIDVVVNPVNDPPRIVGGGPGAAFDMSVYEDLPKVENFGTSISSLLQGTGNPTRANSLQWTDIDIEPNLRGMAIVSANRTYGDWEYTTNDGVTWQSLVQVVKGINPRNSLPLEFNYDVASSHALLLAADDAQQVRLRFLPKPDYHGYSSENSLTFVAWDQTYGVSGSYINLDQLTGLPASAFGSSGNVQVEVFSTNDFPPVLTPGNRTAMLPPVPEHRRIETVPEFTVSQIIQAIRNSGGSVTDEDFQYGIAVTVPPSVSNPDKPNITGKWEFNTGSGWQPFTSGLSLLLDDSSGNRLRFTGNELSGAAFTLRTPDSSPESSLRTSPKLLIRAWDFTAGVSGSQVSLPSAGRLLTESLSVNQVEVQLPVLNINDPPQLSVPNGNTLPHVSLGSALLSDEGVLMETVLEQLYYQNQPNSNLRNYTDFLKWYANLDPDDSPGNFVSDIGLALINANNLGLEIGTEFSPGFVATWVQLPSYAAPPGKFYPIAVNQRLRLRSYEANIVVALHDGGRFLADFNGFPQFIDSNSTRLLSAEYFIIDHHDPQLGTVEGTNTQTVSQSDVLQQSTASAQWWIDAGLNTEATEPLSNPNYQIGQLPDNMLGSFAGSTITIDLTAAGIGWFIDPTPFVDEEFEVDSDGIRRAIPGGIADGKYDLLSVLAHEQGHLLGLHDLDYADGSESLMAALIEPGVRRKPGDIELDALFELLGSPFSSLASRQAGDS